jgi:hypothetical protein
MHKRFLTVSLVAIVLGLANVANAQLEKPARQSSNVSEATQYEIFLKRTDAVIVTQSYSLRNLPGGGGFRVSAKVAWALGEAKKVYAVDIAGRIIDFDQLTSVQDGLDKMIRAVNTSFDTLNASSMSYSSPSGVSASYYSYVTDGSDKPRRNLYLVAGSYTYQAPDTEALSQFRDLIAQARQKLISLGAK